MTGRDRFLSEEDLDLGNLEWPELIAWWNLWLLQAQATNHLDEDLYSHGVFRNMREPGRRRERTAPPDQSMDANPLDSPREADPV